MKFRPVGDELSNTDRQTDMRKLIVAFRNFVSGPKSRLILILNNSEWLVPTA